jgi:heme exporter protein A
MIEADTSFSVEGLACVRGERTVFVDLRFTLESGGALLLLGPNGSGKSSLLRLLAGLLRPAAGTILWDGRPVAEDDEAHAARLAFVGHQDAVKPALTVAENLAFWAGLRDPAIAASTIAMALERFGLGRLADEPARILSAGQRRRLALARLLAGKAPLWLLDEPTAALDAGSVRTLESVIARHRAGGGMVVLSTHTDVELDGAQPLHLDQFIRRPAVAGAAPANNAGDGFRPADSGGPS